MLGLKITPSEERLSACKCTHKIPLILELYIPDELASAMI